MIMLQLIINTYVSLMYELKKNGKVFTSKFVGSGPSSYEKKNLPGRGLTKVENTEIVYNINIVTFRCTWRSSCNANLSAVIYDI